MENPEGVARIRPRMPYRAKRLDCAWPLSGKEDKHHENTEVQATDASPVYQPANLDRTKFGFRHTLAGVELDQQTTVDADKT